MRKSKYTETVGVLFSKDVHELLIKITNREERSISEFIRSIVEDKLKLEKEETKQ